MVTVRVGWALALFLATAIPVQVAAADSFRCNTYLARENMPATEIEQKCGKADLVRVTEEPVFARLDTGVSVQTGVTKTTWWYYEREPGQFVARLEIRDGLVRTIELLHIQKLADLDVTAEP
jgi:hypothetical protein